MSELMLLKSELLIIKNLIENKDFERAYKESKMLNKQHFSEYDSIINSLLYYNFGDALLKIDNLLFKNLKEVEVQRQSDDISEKYKNVNTTRDEDLIDWDHYNDDLDMDQQSEDFWNQF